MRGGMESWTCRALVLGLLLGCSQPGHAQVPEELVQRYLWPSSPAEFQNAQTQLFTESSLVGVSRRQMHDLEEFLRRGPSVPTPDENV